MTTQSKETIELYVKDCSNARGGMPLTSFEVLSPQWGGVSLLLPFGEEGEEKHRVEGWTDLLFDNPYPDVVRGCPSPVHCAKVRIGEAVGYLVWGGNYGVRIGGRTGWGQPIVWVDDAHDLPLFVQDIVARDSE